MAGNVSSQDSSLPSSDSASNNVGTAAAELPKGRSPLPWERQYSPIPSRLPRMVRSNLCDVCLAFEENCLRPWPLSHKKHIAVYLFPHHASWEALELSCRNGCELCTLFRNGYLERYHSQNLRDVERKANETDSEDSEDSASEADPDSTNKITDTRILVHHKSSGPTLGSDNGTDSEDSTIITHHHESSPQSLDGANEAGSEDSTNEATHTITTDHHKSSSQSPDGANEAGSEDSTDEAADTIIPDYYNSLRIRCEAPRSSSDPIRCCFVPGRRPYAAWFNIGAETGMFVLHLFH